MDALQRRPLGAFAFVFYVSLCFIYAVGNSVGLWLVLPLFGVFTALLFFRRRIPFRRALTLISAGLLTASLFSGLVLDVGVERIENLAGQTGQITGTVTDVRYVSSWEGCYTVSVDGMKILLYSDECELKRGDIIECTVVYSKHDSSGDIREYLLSDGIVLTAVTVEDVTVTGRSTGVDAFFKNLRYTLSEKLKSVMPEKEGGFASALVLGDRSDLDSSITRDFRALGISHILAVSGTHLSVLFCAVGRLIPEKHRRLRMFILCPLILFYMVLTGMSSSVVRAGAMMITASLSYALNKRSDSFTSLSVSVMLICVFDPVAPFDAGLQLSFASVLGIILSSEISRKAAEGRHKVPSSLIRKIIPSVVVPAAILPLMWVRFGEISLISPLANILLVPFASILVPLIAAVLILSPFRPLFIVLSSAVRIMISAFLYAVNCVASAADLVLPLNGTVPFAMMVLFTLTAVSAVLCCGGLRRILASASVLLFAVTLVSAQLCVCACNSGMTVCYSAASKDEALCAISEGYSILVDIGQYPAASGNAAEAGISNGSGRFDALFLTHFHKSHKLTLSSVLSEYYIGSLWLPATADEEDEGIAQSLMAEAEKQGIPVYMYLPGEHLRFGDCEFTAPAVTDANNSSHGRVSFSLSCGDGDLCYSAESSDNGGFNITATHGANLSGAVFGGGYESCLLSPKGAATAMSVLSDVKISDSAVIRFSGDAFPEASYPQE